MRTLRRLVIFNHLPWVTVLVSLCTTMMVLSVQHPMTSCVIYYGTWLWIIRLLWALRPAHTRLANVVGTMVNSLVAVHIAPVVKFPTTTWFWTFEGLKTVARSAKRLNHVHVSGRRGQQGPPHSDVGSNCQGRERWRHLAIKQRGCHQRFCQRMIRH